MPMPRVNQQIGNYRIRRIIGEGGMGVVYEAEDIDLHRRVAIKVMREEILQTSGARERFLREARAMAAIKSDHIVTIYQVGVENDIPYFVMELMEGRPLNQYLASGRRLTWKQLLRLAMEMSQGLADAHAQGLIHRDIKPANVFIEMPRGRVKILDFGLARQMEKATQLTKSGAVMGTPHYMAPEQAAGKRADERADLFSLGVIFYQMATGDLPFQGESVFQVLMAIGMHTPPPVRSVCPDAPPALSRLIDSMLEKDPDARPAHATEVMEWLEAITEPEAGFAPPSMTRDRSDTEINPRTPRPSSRRIPVRSGPSSGLIIGLSIATALVVGGIILWLVLARPGGNLPIDPLPGPNPKPPFVGGAEITHSRFPDRPQLGDSVTNSLGMKFMWISAGSFDMGSNDFNALDDETPCKRRRITRPFWMSAFEVTQKEFETVMGFNPSIIKDDQLPVTNVTYEDCVRFCERMKTKTGLDYRLPTEAQWEYACRAGTRTAFSFGDDPKTLEEYAWFEDNCRSEPHPVGRKKPNSWGLYDMHGNVEEWCLDWYDADFYVVSQIDDPVCLDDFLTERVRRGGSFDDGSDECRSSYRYYGEPKMSHDNLGFRVLIAKD